MTADSPRSRALPTSLLLVGLVLPSFAAWAYFHRWAGTPAMMPLYAAGKVIQFGLPILWVWLFARQWPRGILAWRGISLALAFGVATALTIVAAYVCWAADQTLWQAAAKRMTGRMEQAGFADPRWFLAMAAFYCVAHSGLEEYYWRWFIFGRLDERLPLAPAIAIASLAFAAHHALIVAAFFPGEPAWIAGLTLGVATGGGVWCWLYHRSGSLLGPWMSHALVDAALMTVGYLMLGAR